ncbi:MAG: S-layer homology domain-containing protein [Cellulosilyticaceae bacterium]
MMKKFRKSLVALLIVGLVGTAPLTYALENTNQVEVELEKQVWDMPMTVGEIFPKEQIKQSIEQKYGVSLEGQEEVKVSWTEGKHLFQNDVAIAKGQAFIKIQIKDSDESGKCQIIKQCIRINILPQAEPIVHIPYINGYEDGTFRPEQGITREELATMVGRLMLGGQKIVYKESFEDVNDNRYSASYIGYVTDQGIMHGDEEGLFRPMDQVSQKEFLEVVRKIEKLYNQVEQVKIGSLENITRVESVRLLNVVFGRLCDDVEIINQYSDINEQTQGYEDILYASIYHTHQ